MLVPQQFEGSGWVRGMQHEAGGAARSDQRQGVARCPGGVDGAVNECLNLLGVSVHPEGEGRPEPASYERLGPLDAGEVLPAQFGPPIGVADIDVGGTPQRSPKAERDVVVAGI